MASIEHEPAGHAGSTASDDDDFARRVPRGGVPVRVPYVSRAAGTELPRRDESTLDDRAPGDEVTSTAEHRRVRTLVNRRRRGRVDFDGFYTTHYPSVVRLAYSLCGSWSIAEELSQEAFVTAHGRWRRIESFDRPDLWVRRVVINRSISFRRREASERRAVARIRDQRPVGTEPVLSDETVWEALRELSPRQAEVLALFYVEDQPLSAVAEILDLGVETVRTHLKRGRIALADKLEERGHVR